MIVPGLVSVTFRQLSVDQVVGLAVEAGLSAIEWGGDIHVPDVAAAESTADLCARKGLAIAAYGSYFRPGRESSPEFREVLPIAHALGAPLIRVWAGGKGSDDTTPRERVEVVTALRSAADSAAEHGMSLALEFHGKTLTDTLESTERLLDELGDTAVVPYWQPIDCWDVERSVREVRALLPRGLPTVHVFSWDRDGTRLSLARGETMWRAVLAELAAGDGTRSALLEFVVDDDPTELHRDARTLRSWLAS